MSRRRWHFHAVVLAFLVLAASASGAAPAAATHVQCGDVINQSTTLDSDLIDCSGLTGLSIGKTGVTLDLGGHTVDGVGNGIGILAPGCPSFHDTCAHSHNVTIRNGTLREFRIGAHVYNGNGQLLEDLVLTRNLLGASVSDSLAPTVRDVIATGNSSGLNISSNVYQATVVDNEVHGNLAGMGGGYVFDSLFEGNSVHDNEFNGIGFTFSRGNRISNNDVADNGLNGIVLLDQVVNNVVADNRVTGSGEDGIVVTGEGDLGPTLLERNRTIGNGDDGIDVDFPGSTLTRNTANRNRDLGIEAAGGTHDGGNNKAHANGNPAQCVGVSCK